MNTTMKLGNAIAAFHQVCNKTCDARDCTAWTSRGLTCSDCPKEWSDELTAQIDAAESEDSSGDRWRSMDTAPLVDFLIAETSEDAVFEFIAAISVFGITNREDAIAAMEEDPDTRKWAETTARMIPEPYDL